MNWSEAWYEQIRVYLIGGMWLNGIDRIVLDGIVLNEIIQIVCLVSEIE